MTKTEASTAGADAALAPALREAVALANNGDTEGLIALAEAKLADAPGDAAALVVLAYAGFATDQATLCLEALQQALTLVPGSALVADSLAILYTLAGEVPDATYYAKLAIANGFGAETPALRPASWPDFALAFAHIGEYPYLQRGLAALAAGDTALALRALETQAAFSPNHGETQRALADALLAAGKPRHAANVLSRFAANGTADSWDLARLATALTLIGEFDTACAILAGADDEGDPQAAAEIYAAGLFVAALAPSAAAQPPALAGTPLVAAATAPLPDRPRVGLLVTALGPERDLEAVGQLAAGLRDAGAQVIAFGAGALASAHNRPFQGKVHNMIDAAGFDGETLAYTIMGEDLDLLIDAGGVYAPLHLAAMAHHPAPRVAAWLNLPFAEGVAGVDRALAARPAAGGMLLRAGTACQTAVANEAPLIGADVWLGQLQDDFLAAIGAILARRPDARLLLRDRELSQPDTVAVLVERCTAHGFVDRIEIVDGDDLSFAAGLDLMLAPFVAVAGHDVVNAATVATPAVALAGSRPAGRQAALALHALGLGDRVAASPDDYVAKAVALLTDRAEARTATAAAIAKAPTFDANAFAARLLEAFRA